MSMLQPPAIVALTARFRHSWLSRFLGCRDARSAGGTLTSGSGATKEPIVGDCEARGEHCAYNAIWASS